MMEEALWFFIEAAAANPEIRPDPRIWAHVLAYLPKDVLLPKFVTNERET